MKGKIGSEGKKDAVSSAAFTAWTVLISGAGAVVVGFPIVFLPLPLVSGFYWDLNVWMSGMPLMSFCKMIVANVILAMVVPGLGLLLPKLHFLTLGISAIIWKPWYSLSFGGLNS